MHSVTVDWTHAVNHDITGFQATGQTINPVPPKTLMRPFNINTNTVAQYDLWHSQNVFLGTSGHQYLKLVYNKVCGKARLETADCGKLLKC